MQKRILSRNCQNMYLCVCLCVYKLCCPLLTPEPKLGDALVGISYFSCPPDSFFYFYTCCDGAYFECCIQFELWFLILGSDDCVKLIQFINYTTEQLWIANSL
ncbi:unnamed protein product [Gongylonema pulchrum]|uniref:Secreted protein n=1 Tax=Gongylonema pulchrum TaxID=637853 RepID=A0A183CXF9_9BILA|nr:unnamed protein product [Gongylonema pulchrum]